MSQSDNLELPSRYVRGWDKLAINYSRSRVTVRELVEKGCPYQLDGRVHIFDLDKVDEWLAARDEFGEDDDEQGGGKKEFDKEKLRKLKLEADRLEDEKEERKRNTATRDEMRAAYVDGMKQVKAYVEKFIKETKASHAEMSASKAEKLDNEMIALFNRVADIRPRE